MKKSKCELDVLTRECVRCWSIRPNFASMDWGHYNRMLELKAGPVGNDDRYDATHRLINRLLRASGRQ